MSYLDSYRTIAGARDGRVLTLTLNRPDKLNAVDAPMHKELSTIFDAVNLDPTVDVVVLTGAGRAFSAGGDVAWMRKLSTCRASGSARRSRAGASGSACSTWKSR